MKRLATLCLAVLAAMTTMAQRQLAFPEAEGYGRYATGGRGGTTYVVTSLEDCSDDNLKPGTLRWAVNQRGKKIITFAVNGTIYLKSPLGITAGDITILGQTAPGDGICVADWPVSISCENAIIRYMRFRCGERNEQQEDCFTVNSAENVIIDHCSFSWSIDECLSVGGNNVTIQWCMIEEPLCNSRHAKGAHGYGGNWGGWNISYHHNLLVHCSSRSPRTGGDGSLETKDFADLRNNVMYNWAGEGCYGGEATDLNIVNCYYKPGSGTDQRSLNRRMRIAGLGIRTKSYAEWQPGTLPVVDVWGHYYIDGNKNTDYANVTNDNWTYGVLYGMQNSEDLDWTFTEETKDTIRLNEPREFCHVTTHTPDKAYEKVLKLAGASYHRDCVDSLMVYETEHRLAPNRGSNGSRLGFVDDQKDNGFDSTMVENGAWPILRERTPDEPDTDGDGIPDSYETAWGLDPNNANDAAAMYEGDNDEYRSYSYVEVYQNFMIDSLREWNAECLTEGEVEGVDEPTLVVKRRQDWEHEISVLTFKGTKKYRGAMMLFKDDVEMQGSGIAGGNDFTIKLSAGQKKIHVPDNIQATSIRIEGYSQYAGNDIYVSECNGQQFDNTQYVIEADSNRTWHSVTVPLGETVSGKDFTITLTGNSPTVKFYLIEDGKIPTDPTAITEVKNAEETRLMNQNAPIYNLAGQRVGKDYKGIVIQNGKKFYQK